MHRETDTRRGRGSEGQCGGSLPSATVGGSRGGAGTEAAAGKVVRAGPRSDPTCFYCGAGTWLSQECPGTVGRDGVSQECPGVGGWDGVSQECPGTGGGDRVS